MHWETEYFSRISKYKSKLDKITSMLKTSIDIKMFRYTLVSHDGNFFTVHGDLDQLENCLFDEIYLSSPLLMCPDYKCIPDMSITTLIYDGYHCDQVKYFHEQLKSCGFYYPLVIKRQTKFGVELISLCKDTSNISEINFYFTMLPYLSPSLDMLSKEMYDLFVQAKNTTPQFSEVFLKNKCSGFINPFVYFHNKNHSSNFKADSFFNEKLSQREYNCLKFYLDGLTAKEIGSHFNISYRTVENYIARAKNKLGCNTKLELYKLTRNEFK